MSTDLPTFPDKWNVVQIRRRLCGVDGIRIGPFGSALTLNQMVEEGFKVYGQENVISKDFTAGNRYLDHTKYAELKACSIACGDLLVTMMGTTGRCCVVPEEIAEGIMDSHLIRLRFQDHEVDPSFMALLIDKGQYVKEQICAGGKGTIMSGLNSSIIKDVWVGLPDVTVQRRIIKYLDEQTAKIDRLMEIRRRQMELLRQQRAALIQQAVTRGLNPDVPMKDSGIPWLGEIPAHWTLTRIRYLGQFFGGGTPAKANAEYWNGNIPWVSPKDMKSHLINDTEDHITLEGLNNSPCRVIRPNSLLMVVRSGILRKTLPVALNSVPVALNQEGADLLERRYQGRADYFYQ